MRSGASNEIQIGARGLVDPATDARGKEGSAAQCAATASRPGVVVACGGWGAVSPSSSRHNPRKPVPQRAIGHSPRRDGQDHLFTGFRSIGLGLQSACRERVVQGVRRPLLHVHFRNAHQVRPACRTTGTMRQNVALFTENSIRGFSL